MGFCAAGITTPEPYPSRPKAIAGKAAETTKAEPARPGQTGEPPSKRSLFHFDGRPGTFMPAAIPGRIWLMMRLCSPKPARGTRSLLRSERTRSTATTSSND
jgi:hypothetical protein